MRRLEFRVVHMARYKISYFLWHAIFTGTSETWEPVYGKDFKVTHIGCLRKRRLVGGALSRRCYSTRELNLCRKVALKYGKCLATESKHKRQSTDAV